LEIIIYFYLKKEIELYTGVIHQLEIRRNKTLEQPEELRDQGVN